MHQQVLLPAQTLMQYKIKLLCLISLIFSLSAEESYISFDQKLMDPEWSFLPEVPATFDNSQSKELETGFKYKNIKTFLYASEMNLKLLRTAEPKNVSLNADKQGFKIGYELKNRDYLYLLGSKQTANPQLINCYEFSTFILGDCDSANLQISSTNPKYDTLENNIFSINGSTKSYGVGYKREFNKLWIESTVIELINTSYKYNWLSPLEDIGSPFLLNLTIGGIALVDALNRTLDQLPQRNEWETLQLNLGLRQKFITNHGFNFIAEYDLVFLNFSDYREHNESQDFNFRLRAGIEFYRENLSLLFYGDAYLHNLIGFEPITFNQRTEHYFDQKYGELGLRLKVDF